MRRCLKYVLICILAGFLLVGTDIVNATTIEEAEPNDKISEANTIEIGDWYIGELGSRAVYEESRKTDVDCIKFKLNKGKTYTIVMLNYTDFYKDTSLLATLITPEGKTEDIGFDFIYNMDENYDSVTFKASATGTHCLKLYNYTDFFGDINDYHYYAIGCFDTCDIEGHQYGPWRLIKEVGSNTGTKETVCVRCGHKVTEIVSSKVRLNNDVLLLKVNDDSGELYVQGDDTYHTSDDYRVTSDNRAVADIVMGDEGYASIKAKKPGVANIEVHVYEDGLSENSWEIILKAKVIVQKKLPSFEYPCDVYPVEEIAKSSDKMKILNKPSGVKIKWSSSNPRIASVDEEGNVTPLKAGSCKITASIYQKKISYKVIVAKLPNYYGNITSIDRSKGIV